MHSQFSCPRRKVRAAQTFPGDEATKTCSCTARRQRLSLLRRNATQEASSSAPPKVKGNRRAGHCYGTVFFTLPGSSHSAERRCIFAARYGPTWEAAKMAGANRLAADSWETRMCTESKRAEGKHGNYQSSLTCEFVLRSVVADASAFGWNADSGRDQ